MGEEKLGVICVKRESKATVEPSEDMGRQAGLALDLVLCFFAPPGSQQVPSPCALSCAPCIPIPAAFPDGQGLVTLGPCQSKRCFLLLLPWSELSMKDGWAESPHCVDYEKTGKDFGVMVSCCRKQVLCCGRKKLMSDSFGAVRFFLSPSEGPQVGPRALLMLLCDGVHVASWGVVVG